MDKHFADQDLFEINVGLDTVYGIMLTVRARILLIGLINWPLSGPSVFPMFAETKLYKNCPLFL